MRIAHLPIRLRAHMCAPRYDKGDMGFIIVCGQWCPALCPPSRSTRLTPQYAAALVFWMVPGCASSPHNSTPPTQLTSYRLAFLYSGLARRKSALSLIWAVCASNAIVTFQWFFWGYSLAFSNTATNSFIGNLRHFGLRHVLAAPSPGSPLLPELLYAFYQASLLVPHVL